MSLSPSLPQLASSKYDESLDPHNTSSSKAFGSSDAYGRRPLSKDELPIEMVDLASYYSARGGVDLDTLSELTRSVNRSSDEDAIGAYRSKRTCVRVREEMNRLQEIFGDDPLSLMGGKSGQTGRRSGGRGRGVAVDGYGKKSRQSLAQVQQASRGRRRKKQSEEGEENCERGSIGLEEVLL